MKPGIFFLFFIFNLFFYIGSRFRAFRLGPERGWLDVGHGASLGFE